MKRKSIIRLVIIALPLALGALYFSLDRCECKVNSIAFSSDGGIELVVSVYPAWYTEYEFGIKNARCGLDSIFNDEYDETLEGIDTTYVSKVRCYKKESN